MTKLSKFFGVHHLKYNYLLFETWSLPACTSDADQFWVVLRLIINFDILVMLLAEVIKKQHGGLDGTSTRYIDAILRGETNHRVLLMLDGYDEYKPGQIRTLTE